MQDSSPRELRKFVAPEFVIGEGSLSLAGQYARNLGGRRALLVSDPGVIAAGWAKQVQASIEDAGLDSVLFAEVTPNPRIEQVERGASVYADERCDMIVAVGGGSAIDCAKAIGVVASNGGSVLDYIGIDNVAAPMPPTICIPTTAGTSADVSQFAVIRDGESKRKMLIISKAVVPDLSLLDPATLMTMDPFLTAATGADALSHAVEAYASLGHSPVTDLHALQAIRLISENLLKSLSDPQNIDYRANMLLGSLEAGLAFSNASLGVVHALAHSVGGLLDLPHGLCNAAVLDSVVNFNYPMAEERYRNIARAMNIEVSGLSSGEIRKKLVFSVRELLEKAGVHKGLSKCGLGRTEVHELAERALNDPCVVTNPRRPCERDLEVLYEESL
jgi:alcohol dehydrogenase class IV